MGHLQIAGGLADQHFPLEIDADHRGRQHLAQGVGYHQRSFRRKVGRRRVRRAQVDSQDHLRALLRSCCAERCQTGT